MQSLPDRRGAQPMIRVMPKMRTRARRARGGIVVSLIALGLAAAPAAVRAGTIRDDRDPQLYLNLGAAPQYASVGKFDLTKWEPGYSASGTLVDDNWVLTAAHAIEGTASGQFTVGGRTYGVSRWITHPKWDSALRRGYDLALVKLDGTVTDVAAARLYTGKREANAVATFVGFGRTGTGAGGNTAFDGLKRAGHNTIDGTIGPEQWPLNPTFRRLTKNSRSFLVDFDNPAKPSDNQIGLPTPLDTEFLISLGDSGGGAFVDFGKGPQLAGVHSFAEVLDGIDDSDYGDVTGHVRVSAHAKWIRNTIRREDKISAAALRQALRSADGRARVLSPEVAAAYPGPHDSPVATIVPEPGSALLVTLGAILTLRRPRRRPH